MSCQKWPHLRQPIHHRWLSRIYRLLLYISSRMDLSTEYAFLHLSCTLERTSGRKNSFWAHMRSSCSEEEVSERTSSRHLSTCGLYTQGRDWPRRSLLCRSLHYHWPPKWERRWAVPDEDPFFQRWAGTWKAYEKNCRKLRTPSTSIQNRLPRNVVSSFC